MQNTLLLGLSQQMALQRNMDIIAHNLANMETNAYRAERPVFQTYLQRIQDQNGQAAAVGFVDDYGMVRDMTEGRMERTANPLDVAIIGKGYFVVSTPDGDRYTRNGHFSTDNTGTLVNSDGHPVLDLNGGPITFSPEEDGLTIARDGSISTSTGAKGRLQLVEFANDSALTRAGGSLFETTAAPQPATGAELQQGVLEGSNVVPIEEMTAMIQVLRAYDSASKLVKNAEDMTQRAVRELGSDR